MTPVIRQSVVFSCPPDVLFELYMDWAKPAATGARARIGRRAGERFTAFEGALSGRNLMVIPKRMIVQAWRSTNFKKTDPDSVLVLEFNAYSNASWLLSDSPLRRPYPQSSTKRRDSYRFS